MSGKIVRIVYFSDVLCVWAYIAQARIGQVNERFGEQAPFEYRFCNVFGNTAHKIDTEWGQRGGRASFSNHVKHALEAYPEISIKSDVWSHTAPPSSAPAHLAVKAAQIVERAGRAARGASTRLLNAFREAFFVEGRNIAVWSIQRDIIKACDLPPQAIEAPIRSGDAFAALMADYAEANSLHVQGSPTFVLNEGRQKLYGNVGYHVIEANIRELLREPRSGEASWCWDSQ